MSPKERKFSGLELVVIFTISRGMISRHFQKIYFSNKFVHGMYEEKTAIKIESWVQKIYRRSQIGRMLILCRDGCTFLEPGKNKTNLIQSGPC